MGRPVIKPPAHAERSHADISPSGADRWWHCPGSVDLYAKLKPPRTSNYNSELGTAAHELLDMSLKTGRAPIAYLGKVVNKGSKATINQVFTVDRAMAANVEEAVDYVTSYRRPGDVLLTEKELDIPATGQPGHVDVAIVCSQYIDVMDYKNGTNPVDVEGNKQAMLYSLGVLEWIRLNKPKWLKTIKRVRLHIVQPRSSLVEERGAAVRHQMSLADLNTFSEQVRAKVALIRSGKAPRIPGKLQCYYCEVKGRCKEFAQAAVTGARMDFDEVVNKPKDLSIPPTKVAIGGLTNKELANALTHLPLMEMWMSAVRELAAKETMAGRKIPGWKVVEGRANRRWADENKVKRAFAMLRIPEDAYAPRKLVGLGDAKDLLPKVAREPFFNKHCIKPKGSPNLVPESDPRPPFNRADGAKLDFKEDLS